MNIAFLGCGRVFKHHAEIITRYLGRKIRVVGVCDLDREKAIHGSRIFDCMVFDDICSMLESSKPDYAVVLTESGNHFPHVMKCIERGVDVLVEKPLAMRLDQISIIRDAAVRRAVKVFTGYQNRFNPAVTFLKRVIDEGRLGKLVSINTRVIWCRYQDYYEDGWHGTWSSDGGVLNQQAIHHLDIMNWVFGPVLRVIANSTRRLNKLEAEDTISGLIEFSGGHLGLIHATTAARPIDYEASISVVGSKGYIEVGGIALNEVRRYETDERGATAADSEKIRIEQSETVRNGYGVSHFRLYEALLANFLGSTPAPELADIESSAETTRLVHALYRSIEESRWVYSARSESSLKLGVTT